MAPESLGTVIHTVSLTSLTSSISLLRVSPECSDSFPVQRLSIILEKSLQRMSLRILISCLASTRVLNADNASCATMQVARYATYVAMLPSEAPVAMSIRCLLSHTNNMDTAIFAISIRLQSARMPRLP